MAEQWLSIIEYARAYSISDMTVRRRIKTGKLKAVLKDGKYYIPHRNSEKAPSEPLAHFPSKPKPSQDQMIQMQRPAASRFDEEATSSLLPKNDIPESIRHPLVTFETSLVNTQSLLSFCEQVIGKFEDQETHIEKKHQAVVASLESKIHFLQSEVNRYKQQVEDLQLLVKVFENQSNSSEY